MRASVLVLLPRYTVIASHGCGIQLRTRLAGACLIHHIHPAACPPPSLSLLHPPIWLLLEASGSQSCESVTLVRVGGSGNDTVRETYKFTFPNDLLCCISAFITNVTNAASPFESWSAGRWGIRKQCILSSARHTDLWFVVVGDCGNRCAL